MKDFKRWNYWRGSRSSANFEVQELNLNTLLLLEQPWLEVQHQSHKAVACSKSFILCSKTHVSGTFKLTLTLQKTPFMYRLDICQKIYTTRFSGKKFYTLKVHKIWLFLLKKKQRKCINISYFSSFFVNLVCTILTVSVQNHTWCV